MPYVMDSVRERGVLPYPIRADFPVSWASHLDIADVAAALLERPDVTGVVSVGQYPAITGPDLAAAFAARLGRSRRRTPPRSCWTSRPGPPRSGWRTWLCDSPGGARQRTSTDLTSAVLPRCLEDLPPSTAGVSSSCAGAHRERRREGEVSRALVRSDGHSGQGTSDRHTRAPCTWCGSASRP
jgi:hypothetical protein